MVGRDEMYTGICRSVAFGRDKWEYETKIDHKTSKSKPIYI